MSRPLKEELENRVPWLFQDLGFRVTHHDYSDRHMGDSVAELQSDSLRIRFIRDKSRIQVELASLSEPERWLELGFLWYALTGHRPEPELEGLAWFLRDHLSELQDALGPGFSQTKQQFERGRKEVAKFLRYRPPVTLVGRLRHFKATPLGMLLMGPIGWIVAAGLGALVFLTRDVGR
jgi:hypothetical protein